MSLLLELIEKHIASHMLHHLIISGNLD